MESATVAPTIEGLWRDFYAELLVFARRRLGSESEAEDILQAAFLRAHSQLESGTAPANPRGWLYQIVRNLTIDAYRQNARRRETTDPRAGVDVPVDEDPDASEIDEDIHTIVARALPIFIEKLKRPYRDALQLVEIEGLTQAEAAARVGLSLSGMKSRVQRARKQLLEVLDQCCAFGFDARNRVITCDPHDARDGCRSASGACGDGGVE
ncbi:MAG: sigma-70 family RNA polymerase sigma factor [Acidobacteriota bacterium]